jgi:hypothetical protein
MLCSTRIALLLCSVLWNRLSTEAFRKCNNRDRKGFYCKEDLNTQQCTEYWKRMINHPSVPAGLSELVGLPFPNSSRLSVLTAQFDSTHKSDILCGSDNLIPEPPDTAHSCSQHGPVTVWFWSTRPGNILPIPKTSTVLVLVIVLMELLLFSLNFVFY